MAALKKNLNTVGYQEKSSIAIFTFLLHTKTTEVVNFLLHYQIINKVCAYL